MLFKLNFFLVTVLLALAPALILFLVVEAAPTLKDSATPGGMPDGIPGSLVSKVHRRSGRSLLSIRDKHGLLGTGLLNSRVRKPGRSVVFLGDNHGILGTGLFDSKGRKSKGSRRFKSTPAIKGNFLGDSGNEGSVGFDSLPDEGGISGVSG